MTSRHRAREVALQILYQFAVEGKVIPQGTALATELSRHFDHFQIAEPLREFAAQLVAGTLTSRMTLDERLEKVAANWKISRMSFIDRNLLRMAMYEMGNFKEIPRTVTINEAVELAKQFGTSDSPAFVNGILDSLPVTSSTAPDA